jgi:uncharacterized protein (TIGR02996 family)
VNIREALIAEIDAHPRDDTPRLVLADWLDENGEPERAEFIRLQCRAAQLRPGTGTRADAIRAAEDLRAEHEADWLGEWTSRLVTWEYRRGFIWKVRMTAEQFLDHGEELFRTEPVRRLEVVKVPTGWTCDRGDPLEGPAIREVVAHPTFGRVREIAVLNRFGHEDVESWLVALAASSHVTNLRSFGPITGFELHNEFSDRFGLGEEAVAAFCRATHLRGLRSLELGSCPLREVPNKDGLVERIVAAPFARTLRRLDLSLCRLTSIGLRRLANDPAFAGLRFLNVTYNSSDEPAAWEGLFQSRSLKALRSFQVLADRLPEYAGSPLAAQINDLTVHSANDLRRSRRTDEPAWMKLIATAPPPRRLELSCHNPGKAVLTAMRKRGWLRKVRELAIKSDSQYDVFGGRTAGVRSLFRPKAMPRLTKLDLHEVGCGAVLQALSAWPGLSQLESLDLEDDYHGRLIPVTFPAAHALTYLRGLGGVIISTDEDVESFLALPGLDNLTSLQLSFLGHYDRAIHRYTDAVVLTEAATDRLLRSERLSRVTDLTLGFVYTFRIESHVVPRFSDPAVIPRLQKLHLYVTRDGRSDDRLPIDGLRARFGLRLIAW